MLSSNFRFGFAHSSSHQNSYGCHHVPKWGGAMPADDMTKIHFTEFIDPKYIDDQLYFCFRSAEGELVGIRLDIQPLEQLAYVLSDISNL